MSRIDRVTQIRGAVQGAVMLAMYYELKHKKYKTDFEMKAYFQFRKFLRTIMTIISLEMVICAIFVANFTLSFSNDYYHPGEYENGMVRYVDNENIYVSPSEIGLSESELTEGDRLSVYTDRYGNITYAVRQEDESAQTFRSLYMLLAWLIQFVIVIAVYAQYSHKHHKHMRAYLRGETEV